MGPVDGSVVPSAAAGSLPFLPRECVRVLRALRENFGRGRPGDAMASATPSIRTCTGTTQTYSASILA